MIYGRLQLSDAYACRRIMSHDNNVLFEFCRVFMRVAPINDLWIKSIHETDHESTASRGNIDASVVQVSRMNENLTFLQHDCLANTPKIRATSYDKICEIFQITRRTSMDNSPV